MLISDRITPHVVIRRYEAYYWDGIGNEAYSTVTDGYDEYKIVGDVRGSDGFFLFHNTHEISRDLPSDVLTREDAESWCAAKFSETRKAVRV